jgi:hypothetical protein
MTKGFYARLKGCRGDDEDLEQCITRVVDQLERQETSSSNPGMLLGKIQSGKTRAFIGVIALAFDRGFDIAIILTKGTKSLSAQTLARLEYDFRDFVRADETRILDIMKLPSPLSDYELNQKLVIVAKKQVHNLARVLKFFGETYPHLKGRRALLIDDEADLASVRFVQGSQNGAIEQGKIAEQMDQLRILFSTSAFLQVTATPYSLYLQPETYQGTSRNQYVFQPKRPAFTELLPLHGGYVGGDDYFLPHDENDPRSRLVVNVEPSEQDALRRPDGRKIKPDTVLSSPNARGYVRAIVTFILSGCIRRCQLRSAGESLKKYAMIIHNDTQKAAHEWQSSVLRMILEAIHSRITNRGDLDDIIGESRDDLRSSVIANGDTMPSDADLLTSFCAAFQKGEIVQQAVNSDRDVSALLDEKAELKLRAPFNIFVGGNILDRGITIPNLIAFYYGRNPKTMQADTVLQHSRMYGNRDRRDLAVTRLHTSPAVSSRLFMINAFENTLRHAFEQGGTDGGVVFIQADPNNQIRPCAPNKVLLSNVIALGPDDLYLPTGFQTLSGTAMAGAQRRLDYLIPADARDIGHFVTIDRDVALEILSLIESTLEVPDNGFDWDAMCGLLGYYADVGEGGGRAVSLLVVTGRRLDRRRSGDRSGVSILGSESLRNLVRDRSRKAPALILLQQEGTKDLHWQGARFWWPILAPPATAEPCVFSTKVAST